MSSIVSRKELSGEFIGKIWLHCYESSIVYSNILESIT